MNKTLFDNLFDSEDNAIHDKFNDELRKDIRTKIYDIEPLSSEEKAYLKECRDLFIPEDKSELSGLLYYFFMQGLTYLNCINVNKVTDMGYMFQDVLHIIDLPDDEIIHLYIDEWDVSNVDNMRYMFCGYKRFTFDVSKWNVHNVTDMRNMFNECHNFNCDLSNWDVSKVIGFTGIFSNCKKFTSDLSNWKICTKEYVNMAHMFYGCENFNSDLSKWDVSMVTNMNAMFMNNIKFNSDLSGWNVSNVTVMSYMFSGCREFNSDISGWKFPKCTSMHRMFYYCKKFQVDLSKWTMKNVYSTFMFLGCNLKKEYRPKYICPE